MKLFKQCPRCLGRGTMTTDRGALLRCDNCLGDGVIVATPAEIMAAHPKCGECEHRGHIPTFAIGFEFIYCVNPESAFAGQSVDPTTDYCNKWESKP